MPSPNISNLKLSLPARRDIRDILHYTFQHYERRQQNVYYLALRDGLERIAGNPSLGHTRVDLPDPYKAYTIKKHVVVYKMKQDMVYVARILHGGMDFPSHELSEKDSSQ